MGEGKQRKRGKGVRLRDEEVRDLAVDLVVEMREFTAPELARRLDVTAATAHRALQRLQRRGTIAPTGQRRSATGRKAAVFAYVPPVGPGAEFLVQQAQRAASPAVEREAARVARRSGAGRSGRTLRTGRKDVDRLIAEAARHGCRPRRGSGHVIIQTPSGQTVTVAATPSDHRAMRNTASKLRRAGVPVTS